LQVKGRRGREQEVEAVIDSGITGALTLPPALITTLGQRWRTLDETATHYLYDLDVHDYNLWVREKMPVIFVLYNASCRRAYWPPIQEYFLAAVSRRPRKGASTVRIRVPRRQVVNGRAVATMPEPRSEMGVVGRWNHAGSYLAARLSEA
jgi:hypothetical protein